MNTRITITAKRAGHLVVVRTPLAELVAADHDTLISIERGQIAELAPKYQLTDISVGLFEPASEKRPSAPAESLSARLHRLAREVDQYERTGRSLLSTAEKVFASVDDHSEVACLEREQAAIHMVRDIRVLFGPTARSANGSPAHLHVVRKDADGGKP
jgi:hypothetical protein